MERLSINFENSRFGPDIADQCCLKAVIGADGLSILVHAKNQAYILKTWSFPEKQAVQSIRKILQLHEFVSFPYVTTEILFFTPVATVVPARMFDINESPEYLMTLTDKPLGQMFFQEQPHSESVVLWSVPSDLKSVADYFFPKAQVSGHTATLLDFFAAAASKEHPEVFVHVRSSHLQIAAYERGNFLFFNTFRYEKPADVLYFTLLVYNQFFFKPEDVQLTISGELLRESEIHKQFERFMRKIRFISSPTLPGLSEVIPAHTYLDQTIS